MQIDNHPTLTIAQLQRLDGHLEIGGLDPREDDVETQLFDLGLLTFAGDGEVVIGDQGIRALAHWPASLVYQEPDLFHDILEPMVEVLHG